MMKKTIPLLLLSIILFSCGGKKNIPDVSGIRIDLPVERFDRAFFSMDSSHPENALQRLQQDFPDFYPDFMQEILGVNGSPQDFNTLRVTHEFLQTYAAVYDSLSRRYKNIDWLREEIIKGLRFVKYYFPAYKTGKLILFMGPFDAPGVATTRAGLAVGLQQYAGSDFPVYRMTQMQEMFPVYISRRFSPEYISANCLKAVVQELFPDQSAGKPLIEQMVEKGKQWWLLDKFIPEAPDSVKTGYTQKQLDWCRENEGQIWTEIVRNEDLNSLSPAVIQTYIGEAPFTQGFSQENSPGNLGPWLGLQIIKKYVAKNPGLKPEDLMKTQARKIIDEAKYKPK